MEGGSVRRRGTITAMLAALIGVAACDGEMSHTDAPSLIGESNGDEGGESEPVGLRLCNTTSSRVGVAVGYRDSDGWTTEGWWNVTSHTCETLLRGSLDSRYYYLHAVDYDRGGEWAGPAMMCTDDRAFTIVGVDECADRGYRRTAFFEIDTGEERGWTVRLTEPAEQDPDDEAKAR